MAEKQPIKISKVVVDRDLCIGAATCAVLAMKTFRMDDENKAVVIDPHGDDAETVLMGAESCPTKAILVYDEAGVQIYPTA